MSDGPGGFGSEYLTDGMSEDFLSAPKLNTNRTGLPYSNASNHILRETLAARDVAIVLKNQMQEMYDAILANPAGNDIAALDARP